MFRQIAAPGDLVGAVLLSLVFGSIHAFAALMAPLEQALDASRAEVSLGYSLAIASLTCGVFAAPRLLRLPPARLAAISGAFAAGGLTVAAAGQSLPFLLIGYGLVFGFTNGIAYSLFLNRAAHAMPDAQGWSAGIVTATYGLGAAIFAQGFIIALAHILVGSVLVGLAIGVGVASAISAALFRGGSVQIGAVPQPEPTGTHRSLVVWLWLVYFLGASGGLMVIAHASGIAAAAGFGESTAGLAPTAVALGNVAGSLAGGPWGERSRVRHALAVPLALAALSMALLLALPSAGLIALGLCGAAYGGLIAVVPVVIRKLVGNHDFAAVFGRVFTAWGIAGLTAPFAAGALFDAFAGYGLAISLAIAAASAGAIAAMLAPRTSAG